jgi:hypothetical protein
MPVAKVQAILREKFKPLLSISKIPSPITKSFESKKPLPKRDSFTASAENTVDAIHGCGVSLDQNAAMLKAHKGICVIL